VADAEPAAGTVEEVLGRVASGKVTARAALDAEQAKDHPRSTLVEKLKAVADIDEPAEPPTTSRPTTPESEAADLGRVLVANVNVAGTVYRSGTPEADLPPRWPP